MSGFILLALSPTVVGERFLLKRMLEKLGELYVKAGVNPGAELPEKFLRLLACASGGL